MENNETKPTYKEDIRLEINSLQCEIDTKNPLIVTKVIFETSNGKITYKPTKKVTEYHEGIKTQRRDKIKLYDIPQKIKDINNAIKDNNVCHVLAFYMEWETDNGVYKFINGNGMFDKWNMIDTTKKE